MDWRFLKMTLLQMLFMVGYGHAQRLKLNVYDAQHKQPIAGAKISVLNSGKVQTSDANGNVSFQLPSGSCQLAVSSIGYDSLKLKIQLLGDTLVSIGLQPKTLMLDSVVVSTGYQSMAKEKVTGSFNVVDGKRYNEQIGSNALERLRHVVNGVAPVTDRIASLGQNAMLVRGMSTLTPTVQRPLIIVDGFEYQGDLDNINPNDIAEVTFLKDAAAGAIWGAKAANGVIVMNTKKGKYQKALAITALANITLGNKPNLYYDRQIATADLIGVEQLLFAHKYRFADTARITRPPFSEAYELMFAQSKGTISKSELADALNTLGQKDVRDDFMRYFYQNEVNQQFALNLSGGAHAFSWYVSAGRDQNVSTLDAKYNRNTLRLSNQLQLSKLITAGLDLAYTGSHTQTGKPAYGSIKTNIGALPVYSSLADGQGGAVPLYAYYRKGFIDEIGGGQLLDWRYYPLTDYQYSATRGHTNDINATLSLDAKLLDWLKLSAKYRVQQQQSLQQTNNTVQSYYTRNLINMFTQVAANGGLSYRVPMGDILDEVQEQVGAQNIRLQLNADKKLERFNLNMLLGTEWNERKINGQNNRFYGYNAELLTNAPVDVINMYPSYMTGSGALIPAMTDFRGLNNRFISYYANAMLSYEDKYSLTASARRDASNLFGQATNDRWKPLWSIGSAWWLSKEKWMHPRWVQQLKLRGSYGKQGNIDPGKVAVTTLSYGSINPFTLLPRGFVVNYPNPDLRWEEVGMLNLGVDFSLFKGRLSGSVEHYRKYLNDLYASVQIDRTTGIASGSVMRNVGQARGKGWDIELKANQHFGGLRINTDLIINTYTDKITRLNTDTQVARQLMSAGFGVVEGYSTFALFAYPWAGLDSQNGDPMGYYNGEVSKDYNLIVNQTTLREAAYLGSQLPRLFGSFGLGFNWKDLSLACRFSYKLDYYFRNTSIDYGALVSQLNGHADYAERWQNPGDELSTNVPSFVYPINSLRDQFYTNSAILYEKGNQVRLQYVNLSYRLTPKNWRGLPLKAMSVTLVANELGVIWRSNRLGLDPDAGFLPRVARFSFGLSTNF
ncbi:MAG: SusC/RagA family TonB-linked outer membrane protein [Sphingobacteriales bacterium]|nr:MAG: SusC/RagA family TonB-linked outer membrane protein [Sphingobacteriales bacterium]